VSAVRQATRRLSLRAGFLEKREKWRTHSSFSANDSQPESYIRHRCGSPADRMLAQAVSVFHITSS
jgi:hypothetical protein